MKNKLTLELLHSALEEDTLQHHGILGMKWGVRRFQPYPKGYSGDGKYVGKNVNTANKTAREPKKKSAASSNQAALTKGMAGFDAWYKSTFSGDEKAGAKGWSEYQKLTDKINKHSAGNIYDYTYWGEINDGASKNFKDAARKALLADAAYKAVGEKKVDYYYLGDFGELLYGKYPADTKSEIRKLIKDAKRISKTKPQAERQLFETILRDLGVTVNDENVKLVDQFIKTQGDLM